MSIYLFNAALQPTYEASAPVRCRPRNRRRDSERAVVVVALPGAGTDLR